MSTPSLTVVGAGVAGLELVRAIRQRDHSVTVTLIDKEQFSLPRAELIAHPGETNKRIDLEQFAAAMKVEFVQAKLERVNGQRRKLYFKEGEPRDFGKLILATGLTSRRVEIKGDHREGFFYFSDMTAFSLRDLLKISEESTVAVQTWPGMVFSLCLRAIGKEVRVVASDLDFLGASKERCLKALEACQIPVHMPAVIEEAVGEARVKAVKIQPLKVFSSQMVFIDSNFTVNRDFFDEELVCRDTFFTQHDDLYLLGDVTGIAPDEFCYLGHEQNALSQAQALAEHLVGGNVPRFERKVLTAEERYSIIDTFLESVTPGGVKQVS